MNRRGNQSKINFFFFVVLDIVFISIASGMGLLLRFDFKYNNISRIYIEAMWDYLPFYIIGTILVFYLFRMYHTLWVYAGMNELKNLTLACAFATLLQTTGMELMHLDVPRSFYFLSGGVLFMFATGSRLAIRMLHQIKKNIQNTSSFDHSIKVRNVMVIGGGEAANTIIKEIKNSSHIHDMAVKCVIDDDPEKIGKYIQGIRVVGNRETILYYVKYFQIDEIVIAIPSVSKKIIREIVTICNETKCELKILPGIYQLMTGEVRVSRLRNVQIEDLLGRDSIQVDLDSIMSYVKDKVILVTGGGGSIGSELCRQLVTHEPKQLIIVDIYENNAYDIQQELVKKYPNLDLVVLIASVRNADRINHIFSTYKPDIVYHAAAHKHVPLMETSPNEAIKNNVLGTWNTAIAADRYGVSRFVLISTDKAVNPTNIMGASKRICEMIVQTYNNRSKTDFVAVRFGNVLGSNGSVIPLFRKQIKAGGPVTVTHPDIIRYFMTIPEAVSLVLQAGAYAEGGEIFVLEMGSPVKIVDLAKNLIKLSGYKPGEDIKIEYTGLRPGEKLYEELLMAEEGMKDTDNKLIHIGRPIEIDEEKLLKQLGELREICYTEPENIRQIVKEIVPTYQPKVEDEKIEKRNIINRKVIPMPDLNTGRLHRRKK